ncbi:hypothetical protein BCR33DRAFT_782724 [Rhizoclosmatium globosum]|uniref:C2H2-type domain-containing protein n=1 Tax=Rhizoclosmatium globosum TaxID=329046 RepID=A0A1Y2CKR6_9FUNG|nr:hypothetical protein BCR33DRAFT_782724 [Rhizoclosmatium globosum]|eukprot:ORY47611.1 hypothetical protein BCR33DRAFT_782724 [Rhizoclosmatium globosum]
MRYHTEGTRFGHIDTAEVYADEDINLPQLCHGNAKSQQTELDHSLRIHTLLQNYQPMTVDESLILSDFSMLVAPSPRLNSPVDTTPPLIDPTFNLDQFYVGLGMEPFLMPEPISFSCGAPQFYSQQPWDISSFSAFPTMPLYLVETPCPTPTATLYSYLSPPLSASPEMVTATFSAQVENQETTFLMDQLLLGTCIKTLHQIPSPTIIPDKVVVQASNNQSSNEVESKEESSASHRCPVSGCSGSFTKQANLKQHMLKHTGELPFVCEYETCNKRYNTRNRLKVHMRQHTGILVKSISFIDNGKTLIGVGLDDQLYTRSGNVHEDSYWSLVPNSGTVVDVTVLGSNIIDGTAPDGNLYTTKDLNSPWEFLPGGCCVVRTSPFDDGIYGIGPDGAVYAKETLDSNWAMLPNSYSVVNVAGTLLY